MKNERAAFLVLVLALLGLPLAAFGYQAARSERAGIKVIDLEARLPEDGGWSPEVLHIRAGEPVRLRVHSQDVVHSFAIGRTEVGPVDLIPGKVKEIDIRIDEPGTYTFYCTRWCSLNHWRMRGILEVEGPDGNVPPLSGEQAPYLALGIDLDAESGHGMDHSEKAMDLDIPSARPSAERGAELGLAFPEAGLADSPVDFKQSLKLMYPGLSDGELWDLIAASWAEKTTPEELFLGSQLYNRDCSACHGSSGGGNGIMARDLTEPPEDWTVPPYLLDLSDAYLHGKIVRGGMGTGMPGWGDIYSEQEAWSLVDYIRSFYFSTAR